MEADLLRLLVNFAVPLALFLLMLIAGTEVHGQDVVKGMRRPYVLLAGSLGPLVMLPVLALSISYGLDPGPVIAIGLLLLAASPGGGISNYYCYLAGCDVFLSAAMTTLSTVFSLFTVAIVLDMVPMVSVAFGALETVPVPQIIVQLMLLMIFPLGLGMALRHFAPTRVKAARYPLRVISTVLILMIAALSIWSVRGSLQGQLDELALAALLFLAGAAIMGWIMGTTCTLGERAVLVFEAGTRNVGVALLLGGAVLAPEQFGIFASFLSVYFLTEMLVMVFLGRTIVQRSLAAKVKAV